MPPKRRTAPAAPAVPRRSKLAKDNNISAATELEIRSVWSLFSFPSPSASGKKRSNTTDTLQDTLMATRDVRKCLIALNAPANSGEELAELVEVLDPEGTGEVGFETFFAVAALKIQSRVDGEEDMQEQDEEGEQELAGRGEVMEAFRLFTRGEGEVITLQHLKRVARELREDVDEKTLRDMLREANGGDGAVVGIEEFRDVMRRAGVFG